MGNDEPFARPALVSALRALGLRRGDRVIVHSALSAIGPVEDGANGVIDALLEVVGKEGTLLMPALSAGVFDVAQSPARVGIIPETFRKREGVLRSFHPSHSVTAKGRLAEELTRGHLACPTACGEGTPYAKLMEQGGKILLLGVDQDRNTSLHTVEAMVRLPYLRTITRDYLDPEDGSTKTLEIREYPGPHRDFIGLDPLFRDAGIMKIGKVGRAVCRLIDAAPMRDIVLDLLLHDPTAILCDNPSCLDCTTQRAAVKRTRLQGEDFLFSVVSDLAGGDLDSALDALEREGVSCIELRKLGGREFSEFAEGEAAAVGQAVRQRGVAISAVSATAEPSQGWGALVSVAVAAQAPAIVVPLAAHTAELGQQAAAGGLALYLENRGETAEATLERLGSPAARLAFSPAQFAAAGEKPFLRVYSKTAVKRHVGQLYLEDGTFAGASTALMKGNGEVKELLSILRCASFSGPVTLRNPGGIPFAEAMQAFWGLMDTH